MTAAGQHREAAVRLAKAAEQLVRAAVEINGLGPEWRDSVIAWNREADDLLERSLEFHDLAYALDGQQADREIAA